MIRDTWISRAKLDCIPHEHLGVCRQAYHILVLLLTLSLKQCPQFMAKIEFKQLSLICSKWTDFALFLPDFANLSLYPFLLDFSSHIFPLFSRTLPFSSPSPPPSKPMTIEGTQPSAHTYIIIPALDTKPGHRLLGEVALDKSRAMRAALHTTAFRPLFYSPAI